MGKNEIGKNGMGKNSKGKNGMRNNGIDKNDMGTKVVRTEQSWRFDEKKEKAE